MNGTGKRPTIKDIAERAGVSKTTVSFAFNDSSKLSRSTYARVMNVAEAIGYIPDPVARTLATKRLGTIGLLLPQPIQEAFGNPYMFELLRGIGEACHEHDVSLTILPPLKGLLSQAVRRAAVDALVVIGLGPEASILPLIKRRRLPFVMVDGLAAEGLRNVGIDDEAAAYVMTRHILDLGHRSIAVLAYRAASTAMEDSASLTLSRRMAGIDRALRNIGLSPSSVARYSCEASPAAAEDFAVSFLSQKENRPTAVICLSDAAAFGVYAACRRLSIDIPGALSVSGFDDVPFARVLSPPLTTIHQPGREKGERAAALVFKMLRGEPVEDIRLPALLALRRSTAPPVR